MKKTIILSALVGLISGSFAWAAAGAAKKVNLSGTWILDKDKSKIEQNMSSGGGGGMGRGGMGRRYPGGGSQGGGRGGGREGTGALQLDSSLVIEHTEDALKVTHKLDSSNAEQQPFIQTFKLDGSESVNAASATGGEIKTRTSWDKEKLVTLGSQSMSTRSGGAETVLKQEFSLSKDGKTLTVTTTLTTPRGEAKAKEIFTKQSEAPK